MATSNYSHAGRNPADPFSVDSPAQRSPRISANKLGEYLASISPIRRLRILEEQKFPTPYIVSRYTEAQRAIAQYLADNTRDENILYRAQQLIGRANPRSEFDKSRRTSCIEAIDNFRAMCGRLDFGDMTPVLAGEQAPKLNIEDVNISVRPEVLLIGQNTNGTKNVGAIKFYFSKSKRLTIDAGQYITTLIPWYLEEHFSELGTPDRRYCWLLEIPNKTKHIAPINYKNLRRSIRFGCQEISGRWENIEAPD